MMFKGKVLLPALGLAFVPALLWAQVHVRDAWVRAAVPQQKATGAFMRLTSAQEAALIEARSPVAGAVELHEMTLVDNVMRMRAVPRIELGAGRTVELKPGGYHVMLLDLKQPLKPGDTVPLTLVFERRDGTRDEVQVNADVRPLGHGHRASGHGAKH